MLDEKIPQLPRSLADLVRAIGWEATRKLTKRYGGVRLYVPQTMTPEHDIAQTIGMEAALKLQAVCGGERGPSLPKSDALMRALRDAEIQARRAKGDSARTLALDYRLTEGHVYYICGERELLPSPQMDLIGG